MLTKATRSMDPIDPGRLPQGSRSQIGGILQLRESTAGKTVSIDLVGAECFPWLVVHLLLPAAPGAVHSFAGTWHEQCHYSLPQQLGVLRASRAREERKRIKWGGRAEERVGRREAAGDGWGGHQGSYTDFEGIWH